MPNHKLFLTKLVASQAPAQMDRPLGRPGNQGEVSKLGDQNVRRAQISDPEIKKIY